MNNEEVLQHQGLSRRNGLLLEALGKVWWREEGEDKVNWMKQWYQNNMIMRKCNEVNYRVSLYITQHTLTWFQRYKFSWSLLPPFLDGMTGSETNVEDLASPFFPLAPSKTWVDEASISKTCSLPHLVPWARWRTSWHLRCQELFCLPGLFSQKIKEITAKSR